MPEKNNDIHTELETKYKVELEVQNKFKMLCSTHPDLVEFKYAEGTDDYYTKGNDFYRFRVQDWSKDGKTEITKKIQNNPKNNLSRLEYNIGLLPSTKKETVVRAIEHDGYSYNFTIWKQSHIYKMSDATLVHYTVVDVTPGVEYNEQSFIEIEVDEHLVGTMTHDQGMDIIRKYEKFLEPVGINFNKRLDKSLFLMYRR